jgi:hypothetical protein
MQAFSARTRYTTFLSAFLLVALATCGCQKRSEGFVEFNCTDITIKVNHEKYQRGVDQKVVYLCQGKKITWEAETNNIKKFEVEFVGDDLPFGAGSTKFDSDSDVKASIPTLPLFGELTVFKYNLTITDNNGNVKKFDPHIIGGGR